MPIETLDDIVEDIANKLYIYGSCDTHDCDCKCRACWTSSLMQRIRRAAEIEQAIEKGQTVTYAYVPAVIDGTVGYRSSPSSSSGAA